MSLVTIYLCLAAAVLAEVIATIALASSEGLSRPLPRPGSSMLSGQDW